MAPARIRAAVAGDAAALASLARQLGHPDVGTAWLARRLATIDAEGLGAVMVAAGAGDAVLGFAQLLPQQFLVEAPFVELIALVVDAAARGRGVGVLLLRAVEDWACMCVRTSSASARIASTCASTTSRKSARPSSSSRWRMPPRPDATRSGGYP